MTLPASLVPQTTPLPARTATARPDLAVGPNGDAVNIGGLEAEECELAGVDHLAADEHRRRRFGEIASFGQRHGQRNVQTAGALLDESETLETLAP